MSLRRKAGSPVQMLLLVVMLVAPLSVLLALPWLKQQPDDFVFLYSGIAAAVTVIASLAFSVLHDRRLDEWERSNVRFSTQWGWACGSGLVALLLAVPPARDAIVALAADVVGAANPDDELVIIAFAFGFGGVVLAQTICTALMSIGWAFWKSRPAREPS